MDEADEALIHMVWFSVSHPPARRGRHRAAGDAAELKLREPILRGMGAA